jgi:hypothetical protein
MASAGCDRRILRAFYTQYVAVLLILLTFCVAAFQRASAAAPAVEPVLAAREPKAQEVALADMHIPDPFGGTASIPAGHPQLKAVAMFIKSHDVHVSLSLSLDRAKLQASPQLMAELAARAEAVEDFLLRESVPPGSFSLSIEAGVGDGRSVVARFSALKEEGQHERL